MIAPDASQKVFSGVQVAEESKLSNSSATRVTEAR
jgi:hypothetical protein